MNVKAYTFSPRADVLLTTDPLQKCDKCSLARMAVTIKNAKCHLAARYT